MIMNFVPKALMASNLLIIAVLPNKTVSPDLDTALVSKMATQGLQTTPSIRPVKLKL